MDSGFRLMAVLAHPDDESLGVGSVLAHYASEGVAVSVVTATRGQGGRFGVHRGGPEHPGPEALGRIREQELRDAAKVLGVSDLAVLDYRDGVLDRADPREATRLIASHLRRVRPQVVITFASDGAYGHPDHIAISQLTTAALVVAADGGAEVPGGAAPHAVSKLYQLVESKESWAIYQAAFKRLTSTVDGVERQAVPWPDWAITTTIATPKQIDVAWRAVQCHESQLAGYAGLEALTREQHDELWGTRRFYRAMSTVNGGRAREHDLFEGLRAKVGSAAPTATPR